MLETFLETFLFQFLPTAGVEPASCGCHHCSTAELYGLSVHVNAWHHGECKDDEYEYEFEHGCYCCILGVVDIVDIHCIAGYTP